MPVKLIAIDVDGTLLDSTAQLPENNRRVLHEAAVHGIEIVLATGRSFHHTRELATQMPAQTVLILNNGSLVKDRTGLTLASHGLPAETARYIVNETRAAREG
ncbi:MAG: hydrolase, partial [Acidobacteria bacterium]|nr:hydrolase [Acidobacteriota bacterium]